jgi:hypothetical protein
MTTYDVDFHLGRRNETLSQSGNRLHTQLHRPGLKCGRMFRRQLIYLVSLHLPKSFESVTVVLK